MPDYNDHDLWDALHVSIRPLGWRNWLIWPWLVKKMPYLTGSKPAFKITLRARTAYAKTTDARLRCNYYGPDGKPRQHKETLWQYLDRSLSLRPPPVFVGERGDHGYAVTIEWHNNPESLLQERFIMVHFDVLSSDMFALWVTALVGSVIITVGGGLLVGNIVKQNLPNPIVVVLATPTPTPTPMPTSTPTPTIPPTPALQSKPNSNEQ